MLRSSSEGSDVSPPSTSEALRTGLPAMRSTRTPTREPRLRGKEFTIGV